LHQTGKIRSDQKDLKKNLKDLKKKLKNLKDLQDDPFCGSFLRKGKVFAYIGRIQTLKDLKALTTCFATDKDNSSYILGNLFTHPLLHPHISKCECVSCFIHNVGYPWSELFGTPPFDTTIGLVEADLGSWSACEHGNHWYTFTSPT
jgi:hypothetical protein